VTDGHFSLFMLHLLILELSVGAVLLCLCVCMRRYGLSWNPNVNGHLLSASDDHVSDMCC